MQQLPRATREKIWFVFICSGSNVGWPNIGPTSALLPQCLPNVCLSYIVIWNFATGLIIMACSIITGYWMKCCEWKGIRLNMICPYTCHPKHAVTEVFIVCILKKLPVSLDTTAKPYMAFRFALVFLFLVYQHTSMHTHIRLVMQFVKILCTMRILINLINKCFKRPWWLLRSSITMSY